MCYCNIIVLVGVKLFPFQKKNKKKLTMLETFIPSLLIWQIHHFSILNNEDSSN